MKLQSIHKFLNLKPITHEHKYYDGLNDEDVTATAFSLLDYVYGFKAIRESLNREIEENYYSSLNNPSTFRVYSNDYKERLKISLEEDPWIAKPKNDPEYSFKNCFSEEQFKTELINVFQFSYENFESIIDLLKSQEVVDNLAFEWVVIGDKPEVEKELQYGLYCFIKKQCTKMVINKLTLFQNRLDGDSVKNEKKAELIEYDNPHPNIFTTGWAFEFFKEFSKKELESSIESKMGLAVLSFIYRKMIEDKLIYITLKPGEYIRFLNDEYEINLDKVKTLGEISDSHEKHYYYLRQGFKPVKT